MAPKPAVILAFLALTLPAQVYSLWPIPRSLQTGSTALRIASDLDVKYSFENVPADLQAAVAQAKTYLNNDKLGRLVVGRGASDATTVSKAKQLSTLTLSLPHGANVTSVSQEAMEDISKKDESYSLTVPADGSGATLTANTTLGLFRGLTTFGQIWFFTDGYTYTLEAPMTIQDSPAFPYRGFMLDTARNYFPVSDIKRTLDAMSWVKASTFHWHIVDSQSFPLEVPGFMELSSEGAYSAQSVYTTSDVQDIVSYAAARGIDVLVEIDTPGHTSAISKSHPDFIACAEATPWSTFANEPPAGQLRFTSTTVVNFTTTLLSAVAELFPSKYFSTGGDELNVPCYTQDNQTQATLNSTGETLEQALSVFVQTTHAALEEMGKTPVVWEEMVLVHNVTLSNATVVMVWISSDDVTAVAQKGFRIVHAASDYFYLDCGGGGWVGDNIDGNSWCDPFKTWQKSYSFDPLANLTSAEQSLILGGEHLLWTEQSSHSNLDPIVWPRAASSAEVFWTGATLPDGTPRNVSTALPRLHELAFRMQQRGVNAIPLQPLWCALRPGVCDLDA